MKRFMGLAALSLATLYANQAAGIDGRRKRGEDVLESTRVP